MTHLYIKLEVISAAQTLSDRTAIYNEFESGELYHYYRKSAPNCVGSGAVFLIDSRFPEAYYSIHRGSLDSYVYHLTPGKTFDYPQKGGSIKVVACRKIKETEYEKARQRVKDYNSAGVAK